MKQVGEINYLGDILEFSSAEDSEVSLPYVIFHDSQVTRIEFSGQEECAEFHQKLLETGWTLFDLTD